MVKLAAVLTIAILAAAEAQARTPMVTPFCQDLRRMIAAVREPPPSASRAESREDRWLRSNAACRTMFEPQFGIICRLEVAHWPEGRRGLAERVRRCVPEAVREYEDDDSILSRRYRLTRFRADRIRIDIAEYGWSGNPAVWRYELTLYAPQ